MAKAKEVPSVGADMPAGRVTFADGEEVSIGLRAVLDYVENNAEKLLDNNTLEITPIGGGLVRITPHVGMIDTNSSFAIAEDVSIPVSLGSTSDGLRANADYYIITSREDGSVRDGTDLLKTKLLADSAGALQTERPDSWSINPVGHAIASTIADSAGDFWATETLQDGTVASRTMADYGLDPKKLVAFWNKEEERYITFSDLAGGLFMLRASIGVAMTMSSRRHAPMVLRTGKHFTEGMRATSKRGISELADGTAFVMAGSLMISADKAKTLSLTVGEKKILAYLNHLATTGGYGYEPGRNCIVRTTVDEILEKRGLSPTDKNRRRVRQDIRTLARQAWEFESSKTSEWLRIPLAGGAVKIRRGGEIEFTISADYMHAILSANAGLLPMDPALLRTDDRRNPHAYVIGYKLTTHAYQNYSEANQCTLSVKSLLDYVESLPKPEELPDKDYTRRIIEPMERDLNALIECGVLSWWDYCHAKGEPLTDSEQALRLNADGNDKPLSYAVATKANIQWQFAHDYADHMAKTQEAREKHRAEAAVARQAKADREKRIQRGKERRIAKALADKEIEASCGTDAPPK